MLKHSLAEKCHTLNMKGGLRKKIRASISGAYSKFNIFKIFTQQMHDTFDGPDGMNRVMLTSGLILCAQSFNVSNPLIAAWTQIEIYIIWLTNTIIIVPCDGVWLANLAQNDNSILTQDMGGKSFLQTVASGRGAPGARSANGGVRHFLACGNSRSVCPTVLGYSACYLRIIHMWPATVKGTLGPLLHVTGLV